MHHRDAAEQVENMYRRPGPAHPAGPAAAVCGPLGPVTCTGRWVGVALLFAGILCLPVSLAL